MPNGRAFDRRPHRCLVRCGRLLVLGRGARSTDDDRRSWATSTAAVGGVEQSGGTSASSCPTGAAAGATASQVTVAASIINITGGSLSNSTVGVPSAQEQEADWNLVAASINSSGGAGCRKIVMKFYDVNPVDAAAAQQACLNIAADHPYIVLDSGALRGRRQQLHPRPPDPAGFGIPNRG